jgi:colicin import membrane protein
MPRQAFVVITSVQLYVMSDATETERRICRFPGCHRPAADSQSGAGRPPEYCDDSLHNRTAAWHARRRLRMEQSGHAAGIEQRPVDAARQRASELHGQVAGMIEHLSQQLQGLLEELRTVADPETAELQIEAVTSQAAEQVATAVARASRAEQAQRRAETERTEADAAAEEASALCEQLRTRLQEARQQLTEAETERDRVEAELADALAAVDAERKQSAARSADVAEKLTVAEARLVEAHRDRDAAIRRAEAAKVAQSEAEERSRNAVDRVDAESARAARAEDAVDSVRRGLAQADQQVAELRNEVSDLRGTLAAITAQRDAAVHDAEREKTHGHERVDDLRARHEEENRRLREELAELRGELNTARDEALVQRSRADRAEARLDNAATTKVRRRQSHAGRARRRGEITATGTEETRD